MSEKPVSTSTALHDMLVDAYSDESPQASPEKDDAVPPLDENLESTDENPQVEDPVEEQVADKIYLNDFATDTETEVADVYQLSVPLNDDLGDESISELKDFRIENADIVARQQEIKDKESDLAEREDQLRDVPRISNELMQARAKVMSIQDQYNGTNWDQLRVNDKQEWSVRQQEFNNAFQQAKAEEARATETVDAQSQQARQFAQDRLFEAMPELKDDSVRQEVGLRVSKFASRYGFSQTDVANIDNPNLMRLLIDVSKLDVAKEQAKQKMKDRTPKSVKPSKKPMPTTRKASLDKLKQRAMSGGKKEKSDFIKAMLT
ncbi:MAG: hypothetical protein DRR06_19415 [Gammaproteobacteria bacterium]|nr:MAG: hypothetical protein DRR06_19415 [Gammaproteobacteria bacterium]